MLRSPILRGGPQARALLAALALTACERATAPRPAPEQPPARRTPVGLVEVTLSGLTQPQPTASVRSWAEPLAAAGNRVPWLSLGLSPAGGGTGGIQLEPVATGSFTQGARGAGGVRYVYATFKVRNADVDGNAYATPRQNLTFLAVSTDSTLAQTALRRMERFDGTPANPAIALTVLPTGAVGLGFDGRAESRGPDVLQVYEESEVAALAPPAGVTSVFPYGYVVRHATNPAGTRTLGANPAQEQFDGLVTFAFKVPLQPTPAEDPFTVSVMFLAVDESEARVTQSPEEQTAAGAQAARAWAEALNATLTALPGTSASIFVPPARTVCAVRIAGPAAAPTAYLVNQVPATLAVVPLGASTLPLPLGGGRALTVAARDAQNTPLMLPVAWENPPPSTVALTQLGGADWLARAARTTGSATLEAQACGKTTAPVTLRVSDRHPLAGGLSHSLALKTDGTVVGWGDSTSGRATPPPGLTNVVAIAAGQSHSLALKADGTVVGWGSNTSSQRTPPAGLTNAVAIAAGMHHSLALKSDGTVVGWGSNANGQTTVRADLTDVVAIAAGGAHSLALRANGTVVAWGWDSQGQATVPEGLTNVVAIAAGDRHSLALRADGTVVGWGDNTNGQTTPPTELTSVVAITAGQTHSLALRADGTVVGWGNNSLDRATAPAGLADVVMIVAGGSHNMALKSDGTVVAWGNNFAGQATVPGGLSVQVP